MRRFMVAVLLGVALSAALYALQLSVMLHAGVHLTLQSSVFYGFCKAIEPIIPGFLAGWVARQRGVAVGLLVAIGSVIVYPLVGYPFFGFNPLRVVLINGAVTVVLNAITQSIGSIAGESCSQRGATP